MYGAISSHLTRQDNQYHHQHCNHATEIIENIQELQLEIKLCNEQLARAAHCTRKHPAESKAKVANAFAVNACTLGHGGLLHGNHNNS